MTALIIILAILLAILALLMLQAHVTVEYRDAFCVRISVLGIPLWRYPKKKKKVRISDYTQKKIARRKRREEKKLARKQKRQNKKTQKKQARATPASAPKKGLLDNLGLIRDVLTVVLGKTAGHVRLRARRIIINVATDDAAKTAILFGAVNQTVVALIELLDQMKKWRGLRSSEIAVNADFAAEKSTADISITISLRVWQVLNILFHAALGFVKNKIKPTPHKKSTKKTTQKQS